MALQELLRGRCGWCPWEEGAPASRPPEKPIAQHVRHREGIRCTTHYLRSFGRVKRNLRRHNSSQTTMPPLRPLPPLTLRLLERCHPRSSAPGAPGKPLGHPAAAKVDFIYTFAVQLWPSENSCTKRSLHLESFFGSTTRMSVPRLLHPGWCWRGSSGHLYLPTSLSISILRDAGSPAAARIIPLSLEHHCDPPDVGLSI